MQGLPLCGRTRDHNEGYNLIATTPLPRRAICDRASKQSSLPSIRWDHDSKSTLYVKGLVQVAIDIIIVDHADKKVGAGNLLNDLPRLRAFLIERAPLRRPQLECLILQACIQQLNTFMTRNEVGRPEEARVQGKQACTVRISADCK